MIEIKNPGYFWLDTWVLANVIQLATQDFCLRFLNRTNDPCGRQFDQMTQAARSAPANIAEGNSRHSTSRETEMKLTDVARASLAELAESELWQRLKDARLVDEHGQPLVSRPEAALMAYMLAERLHIDQKWKFFEQLWQRKNMRNDYNTALEQRKSLDFQDRPKEILG